ncbi:MAG: isoprenylcysteine carboxylmethyltransferase family protein [Terriglobia bacterium]
MSRFSVGRRLARWRVPLGFLVALFYFLWARPTLGSILAGSTVAFVGLGWRAWASGMLRKNATLAVDGPYRLSRNPLYFGSFLIALGFAWASHGAVLFLGIVFFFVAVYWPVMRQEEKHLQVLFGEEFIGYSREVPLFLPWKRAPRRGKGRASFNWGQYWRNREYNALLGFCGAVAVLFLVKYLRGL